jgi:hypothetical protein
MGSDYHQPATSQFKDWVADIEAKFRELFRILSELRISQAFFMRHD